MGFNKSNCIIRKIYCGNGNVPKDTATKKYSRKGTNYECLQRGYGIADWEHRKKNLSQKSLQQIPYIGSAYEANFKKQKITSIDSLFNKIELLSAQQKKELLLKVCRKSTNAVDYKAFNSVLLFLHERRVKDLPQCKIVNE
jgi:hypothetical protein